MKAPRLRLGSCCELDGSNRQIFDLPAHHLITHGVVVGMTGSGKTGLLTVLVEEALRAEVPVLIIDVKGDLPNLLLRFPNFDSKELEGWIETTPTDDRPVDLLAADLAAERRGLLATWQLQESDLKSYCDTTTVRVITPGSSAGELLHLLSSLERPNARWQKDPESARDTMSAAVSLVLRLLGRPSDPAKSREHVLLSVLAELHLSQGEGADLRSLLQEIVDPPFEKLGALELNDYLPVAERKSLAAALNSLLVSPTFQSWRQGSSLDVGEWFTAKDGKTPAVVLSVAHLDDEERSLVLGIVLEELLAWVRTLAGSSRLRSLVVFDEVYGFLPPHPANPPTKRPMVALMKQARAFGVGIVVATQNPMDLDYRALGNAGMWCIGRLQTDADCERVLDALESSEDGESKKELGRLIKRVDSRWFLVRDVHNGQGLMLLQARYAMTLLRGPMTRNEIRRARKDKGMNGAEDKGGQRGEVEV